MFDHSSSVISKLSVHYIGNKTNGEDLISSKHALELDDVRLKELLMKFFLQPFSNPEFFNFTFSNKDFRLNPLFNFASQIFEHKKSFHINTVHIAKHLYELSTHPQIKSGDLFVVLFSNMNIDNVQTDAIGIFKSENRQPFLKLDNDSGDFYMRCDDGINIEKLDKGCLILNIAGDEGYKICVVDKSNKAAEAIYWTEDFLQITPCADEYHQTKQFMNIAKSFVTQQLTEDFEVTKADQIDLLNRSVEYFKSHENFDKGEFEEEVFQDKGIIKSFRKFDETYRDDNEIELNDSFEISPQAVKKQAKIFKSVLKLDKNFHIYIHGDRELIEQGVEKDGRKYYKIYYKDES